MVGVTFDDRERSLYDAFCAYRKDDDVVAECVRLDMADILGRADNLCVAVERKRIPDLVASLFDGRLTEQLGRMRTWQEREGDGAWVVLLLEGVLPGDPQAFPGGEGRWRYFVKVALQLVAEECHPADRRLVLRTADEGESAALIATRPGRRGPPAQGALPATQDTTQRGRRGGARLAQYPAPQGSYRRVSAPTLLHPRYVHAARGAHPCPLQRTRLPDRRRW